MDPILEAVVDIKHLLKYVHHQKDCALRNAIPSACSCGLTELLIKLGLTSPETKELERVKRIMRLPNAVFVFGSNEAGRHGAGAAKDALDHYGAMLGEGLGFFGRSYAIPTKDDNIQTLPINWVKKYVEFFIDFARCHPELEFAVTRIGCGLAGFTDAQIAPFFAGAPENCHLPEGWRG